MYLELRQRLQQVTDRDDISKHLELVESLKPKYKHSLLRVDFDAEVDRYTCAVYAFDLVDDPTYIEIATYGLGKTFAGREFVEYILDNSVLTKLGDSDQRSGHLAIYFDNGEFRHVGKVQNRNRIISKWGTGLLWEHDTWEVPVSYGNEVYFYAVPSTCTGPDLFCAYAATQGFYRDRGENHK